jgi:23S rRNA pseudouridine1911/1915/1917 synthase
LWNAASRGPRANSLCCESCHRAGANIKSEFYLAYIGHPIVGDKLYGGDEALYLALVEDCLTPEQRRRLRLPYHALHAREVRFTWHERCVEFSCEPETWFNKFTTG